MAEKHLLAFPMVTLGGFDGHAPSLTPGFLFISSSRSSVCLRLGKATSSKRRCIAENAAERHLRAAERHLESLLLRSSKKQTSTNARTAPIVSIPPKASERNGQI